MTINVSTGLRTWMLSGGHFKAAMDGGLLVMYSGTPPATADDALSGNTALVTISLTGGGGGISFATNAIAGVLSKAPGETWQGTNVATDTATFFRFYESGGDPALASTTEKRFQGSVGVISTDIILGDAALAISGVTPMDSFNVTIPFA